LNKYLFLISLILLSSLQLPGKDNYRISEVNPGEDPLDQALESLGLSRETCAFPLSGAAVASDKRFEVPPYRFLLYHPFDIPYYLGHLEYNVECYRDQYTRNLIFMSSRAGGRTARGYFSRPLAGLEARLEKSEHPLLLAIEEIHNVKGSTIKEKDREMILEAEKELPGTVISHAALILLTSARAHGWVKKAIHRTEESEYSDLLEKIPSRLTPSSRETKEFPTITEEWEQKAYSDIRPLHSLIDQDYLACGALDLMKALEKTCRDLKEKKISSSFRFEHDTPLGRIILNGRGGNNRYPDEHHYLLIMDFGGDDFYESGAGTASPEKPVSIIMDYSGNDTFLQKESGLLPCFGAGILGYGFLFDFEGNDRYICPQFSQGCGLFGFGWLMDFSGNDTYESIRFAQGYARGGVGFLYDLSGDDIYFSMNCSQGCGETRGCGMILDEKGNDEYIADDSTIRFPSAQNRNHNRSTSQGAGMGERADENDGHSLPGGIGILLDKQGNDSYFAGVFAQGMGFWNGVGILIDSGGCDEYKGAWYVQGAGIHGGIGALCERDGNDTYTATLHASQGLGHDNSIGLFLDEKGSDVYNAPRLSLGTGNANSIGLFFELEGNDLYRCSSNHTLGRAQFSKWGTLREDRLNVGIFLDTRGNDRYEIPHGGDNRLWIQQPSKGIRLKSELGVGLDGDFVKPYLRLRPLTQKPPNVEW